MGDSVLSGRWEVRTNESLPEVVCLSLGGISTRPLPIDLILDGGHGDECSYHATPSTCLYWKGGMIDLISVENSVQALTPCSHGSITKVSSRGDSTSTVTLG